MKKKNRFWIRTIITITLILNIINSCKKEEEKILPSLSTDNVFDITSYTATTGGNVISDGNATITERGICYSTNTNPTIANSKIIATGTTGLFTCDLTDLTSGTTYYVRAYATNSVGIAYGNEVTFTTIPLVLPTITTTNITNITTSTATSGGNVTSDGNATITERGICYSTTTNPTIANSKIIATGTTGMFTSNLVDLAVNTTYYVRAYATNSVGVAYGTEVTFTTLPILLPTAITTYVTNITKTTAKIGGNISFDGNTAITERGICYSIATNPTIANSKIIANGTMGMFTSNLVDLAISTTYYVRAYAINCVGAAYGNELTFTTYNFDAISDIDNNYYNIITIGSQTWMKENLKTTKFRDGSTIAKITDNPAWYNQITGAYCWFNNDTTNKDKYGALYNWFTVIDSRNLCPTGWHVPTDTEWKTLEVYLGMSQAVIDYIYWRGTDQGVQMKSTNGWNNNGIGNNSSGFSALPSGFRGGNIYGPFMELGNSCGFWSATEFDESKSWYRFLHSQYGSGGVYRNYVDKENGQSIRCLKDN